MRWSRYAIISIVGAIALTSASRAEAFPGHLKLKTRLEGSAGHPTMHGWANYRQQSGQGRFKLRARHLRSLRGRSVTIYLNGYRLGTEVVRYDGVVNSVVAGTGLVDEINVRPGSRVILQGPRDHVVAHGRLRRVRKLA